MIINEYGKKRLICDNCETVADKVGVKQMTKYKKYYAGENHYQWEVKLVIYQKHNLYKFVLTDDEDTIYILPQTM